MKPPLYQVVDFSESYENYKSKNIDRCSWYAKPNDWGIQWNEVMSRGERGAAILGIFGALLDLLSRQRRPRLGFFTHDGKEDGRRYTLSQLGMMLYQTEGLMVVSFELLTSPDVNWITVVDPTAPHVALAVSSEAPREDLAVSSQSPHEDLAVSPQAPLEGSVKKEGRKEERELNGSRDSDPIQHSEAKQLLGKLSEDVFDTPLRDNQWPAKWEHMLSEALPMRRENWALIDRFYRLPKTHQIFTVTMKRQSMGALIENLVDEPMKIRSAWVAIGRNGSKPSEPERLSPEWVAAIKKLYGVEAFVPEKKTQLPPSVRVEVEELLNATTSQTA